MNYSYTSDGKLAEVKDNSETTKYEYDKLDRLVRVVERNGYATLYEYDENGNRTAVRYANGIVVSYKYDEVNRLISEKALDKQGGLVAQYEYILGEAGERTKVKELDRTVEYTYDALYRLTGEKITVADGTVTEYTYAYDNVSNRILKTENGTKTTYTYNALNQLVDEVRKLFLLFLRPIINGVGNYYIEAETRNNRRTDVIVDYLGEQYIIEMKIWHGGEYNTRGEQQLADYLEYYHISKGYLLSFHFNKNKETGMKTINIGDKTIIEAVV